MGRRAVTYIKIAGEEVELDQVSDETLKELGLEGLRRMEPVEHESPEKEVGE